jgi:hypothetical protein
MSLTTSTNINQTEGINSLNRIRDIKNKIIIEMRSTQDQIKEFCMSKHEVN